MTSTTDDVRAILEQYARALLANAQATTEQEQDLTSDDLVEITGTVEEHGENIARLLLCLLAESLGEAPK